METLVSVSVRLSSVFHLSRCSHPSLSLSIFRLSLLHFVQHFRHLRLSAVLDVFETIFGGTEFWKTLKMFHVVSDI